MQRNNHHYKLCIRKKYLKLKEIKQTANMEKSDQTKLFEVVAKAGAFFNIHVIFGNIKRRENNNMTLTNRRF